MTHTEKRNISTIVLAPYIMTRCIKLQCIPIYSAEANCYCFIEIDSKNIKESKVFGYTLPLIFLSYVMCKDFLTNLVFAVNEFIIFVST